MKIKPNSDFLLIKKHQKTALKVDIKVAETDEDKRLMTGEVLQSQHPQINEGDTVIFGKYALLRLTIKGTDYHLLNVEDVVGTCSYKEDENKRSKS